MAMVSWARAWPGEGGPSAAGAGVRRRDRADRKRGRVPVRAARAVEGLPAGEVGSGEGVRAPRRLVRRASRGAAIGADAVGIDRARHTVLLADGDSVLYSKLLLATGASPRRLPIPAATRQTSRTCATIADSERLRASFVPVSGCSSSGRVDRPGGRRSRSDGRDGGDGGRGGRATAAAGAGAESGRGSPTCTGRTGSICGLGP